MEKNAHDVSSSEDSEDKSRTISDSFEASALSDDIQKNLDTTADISSKGQLISECPFAFQKNTQKFDKFLPQDPGQIYKGIFNLAQDLKRGKINKIRALSYNFTIYIFDKFCPRMGRAEIGPNDDTKRTF